MQFRHGRNQFGDPISIKKWQIQYSSRIANGRFGCHGTISDDLGHLIAAIFFDNIIHNTRSTFIVKIDIDIWHADTIWI